MHFGDYNVEIIPDSEFRLDGGAMFGVVPRVLWEKKCPPDEFNRIRMNMNCLFIETPDERILVETGIGEKWSARETGIYGIRREKPLAESLFEKTGFRPEDISIVVNTHLHFDHAGGNTILERNEATGAVATGREAEQRDLNIAPEMSTSVDKRESVQNAAAVPQFPNARYMVSRSEFEHAENPHERDRASYLPENWQPVADSGQLELMPDSYQVVDGLFLETVRGHSETMQTVRLTRGGRTLYGFADLIPMKEHFKLPWIAGFDLYPTETLEAKKMLLSRAAAEDWICLLYHDPETSLCSVNSAEGKFTPVELV